VNVGQWRYASSKLKTIWHKQHGSKHSIASTPAADNQQQEPASAAVVDEQPAVDASGRVVMLKSAEAMFNAFCKDSKQGRALLQEVGKEGVFAAACKVKALLSGVAGWCLLQLM
jgi:hypothetical protein